MPVDHTCRCSPTVKAKRAGDPPGLHRPRRATSWSPTRSSASSTSSASAPATPSRR
ncbi:MAG: hypothetical protein MZW92_14690 [Comamonadaceae bacterium]|nr:hypothetical protein [Comamonadaceae bacterium]